MQILFPLPVGSHVPFFVRVAPRYLNLSTCSNLDPRRNTFTCWFPLLQQNYKIYQTNSQLMLANTAWKLLFKKGKIKSFSLLISMMYLLALVESLSVISYSSWTLLAIKSISFANRKFDTRRPPIDMVWSMVVLYVEHYILKKYIE